MEKFTKRDLIELLSALSDIDAIVGSDSKAVSFIYLATTVGKMLDISMEYAYKERSQIQNRVKNTTPFLDILKNALSC